MVVLTQAAVSRLGLSGPGMGNGLAYGAAEPVAVSGAWIDSIKLGEAAMPRTLALVDAFDFAQVDGLLGRTMLKEYELDLDYPNKRLVRYRSWPCRGMEPAGPGRAKWLAVSLQDKALYLPVEVNGILLITGATATLLVNRAAVRAEMKADEPGRPLQGPMAALGGRNSNLRLLRFETLSLGEQTTKRPWLIVGNTQVGAGDGLLGSDILSRRRLWVAVERGEAWVIRP